MSNDLLFDAFKVDTGFEDIPIMLVFHRHALAGPRTLL